jgi:hydrogenase nickel incorporation protein HypA/HybF
MHELSIAMSMIELAEEEAAARGEREVVALHLKIGALSGVVPRALAAAYELARENTPLAECRLVIEETAGPEMLLTALEFAP